MRRLSVFLVTMTAAFVCGAQVTPDVQKLAEDQFRIKAVHKNNLHSSTMKFPDGVRGSIVGTFPETPIVTGSKAFKSVPEELLHQLVCNSGSVIEAHASSQYSFLTSAKEMIVTDTTFHVSDIIWDRIGLQTGNEVHVFHLGGEVTDDGERLRVQDYFKREYAAGKDYLLFARRAQGPLGVTYLIAESPAPDVKSGRIYPRVGLRTPFLSGDTPEEARADIRTMIARVPCV